MGLVLLMHLKKIISEGSETESKRRKKTNKIWVVQGSEFYNNSFKDLKKKKITLKCIQHTMKENLLLPRDLLEH